MYHAAVGVEGRRAQVNQLTSWDYISWRLVLGRACNRNPTHAMQDHPLTFGRSAQPDSITAQAYDSLALLLGNQGPIIERVLSAPTRRLDATRALFLDPSHPLTAALLAGLDLPSSRLQRPIARTIRSDYLIVEEDLEALGIEKVEKTRVKSTEWETALREATRTMKGEEGVKWERSIVVTSVGNWWERWIDKGVVSPESSQPSLHSSRSRLFPR
jgi:hypothetical protein